MHLDLPFEDLPDDYVMMGIDIERLADTILVAPKPPGDLPATQRFGDTWLHDLRSPVLAVPSVLAPRAMNYLLNPLHHDFSRVFIVGIEDFKFDMRLWR